LVCHAFFGNAKLTAESVRLPIGESFECPLVKFHSGNISDNVAEECGGDSSCGKKLHV
jgi:hypothetical protein